MLVLGGSGGVGSMVIQVAVHAMFIPNLNLSEGCRVSGLGFRV